MTIDLTPDTTAWRRSLRELARVIGPKAAMALHEAVKGVETPVPKRADPQHPLVGIIGYEAFQALVGAYGGQRLDLPRGIDQDVKKVAIMDAAGTGSKRAIALRLGVSQRYVRRVTNELAGDDSAPQSEILDLFSPLR